MKLSEQVKEVGEKFLSGEYERAVRDCGIKCFYRSGDKNDDRQCAFGRLITDEEFQEILDLGKKTGSTLKSINETRSNELIDKNSCLNRFKDFNIEIDCFQSWHDSSLGLGKVGSDLREKRIKELSSIVSEIKKKELDTNSNPAMTNSKETSSLEKFNHEPKTFKITNIEWDIDREDVDLPTEKTIECYHEDDIANELSDAYGWCVKSFSIN